MKTNFSNFGFTLVELIVVMAIIAILAGMITGAFTTSQMRSRDATRKSDLRNIAAALEIMYSDYQRYPRDNGAGLMRACPYTNNDPNLGGPCDPGDDIHVEGESVDDPVTIYLKGLPDDPTNGKYHYRVVGSSFEGFQLFARLENINDNDCMPNSQGEPDCESPQTPNLIPNACGTEGECNFQIRSSNVGPLDN